MNRSLYLNTLRLPQERSCLREYKRAESGETRTLGKIPYLRYVLTFEVFSPYMQFLISNLFFLFLLKISWDIAI